MSKLLQQTSIPRWSALARRLKTLTGKTALAGAFVAAGWLLPENLQAQSIKANYDFAASSGTFTALGASATQMPLLKADSYISASTPLGFTFNFDGVDYTHFKASSNGFISFNTTATSSETGNNLNSSSSRPIIAPLWDDLDGNATGGISNAAYEVTGTAGSRVFTFEWRNWEWRYDSNNPVVSFQVKLYEGSNKIEFVYQPESGAVVSGSASVGLAGAGAGNFMSLNNLLPTATSSTTTEVTNVNTKPAAGQVYTFSRPAPSAIDIMATALASPLTPACYGPNQLVQVTIKNNGTAPLNFATTPVTVNGAVTGTNPTTFPAVTVNTGTLAPGATQNVTLATAFNMSAIGTYTFNASATVAGDGRALNDAIAPVSITTNGRQVNSAASLPQSLDFTGFNGSNLATINTAWSEASGATVPSGTTSTWVSKTGLGGANNVTAKINLWSTSKNEWLVGPKVIPTATSVLKFKAAITDYDNFDPIPGMHTDDKVQVMISTDCGSTFTPIFTMNQASNLTNTLTDQSVSLAAYAGQPVIVAFFGTEGTTSSSSLDYDFHLDDIFIGTPPSIDLSATALVAPVNGTCLSATEPVIVTIKNLGPNQIDFAATPTTVTVNVTGAVTQTLTFVVNTGSIAPNGTLNVTAGTLNMTGLGTYTFNGNVTIAGDGNANNNAFAATSVLNGTISTFPALQDFENFTPIGGMAAGNAGWTGSTTGIIWEVEEGTSGSTGTGPTVDHTLGTATGNYVFLETSSGSTGDVAELITPCVDLTGQTSMGMEFWYHMHGPTIDTLKVDIYNGTAWVNNVLVIGGQQQPASADPWKKATINLSAYSGSVIKVRFRGKRGNDFTGDIAIDDVRFFQLPPVELELVNLQLPSSGCGFSASETICVTIRNTGAQPITNIPLNYQIGNDPAVAETAAITLASGATTTYCFTTKANFSAAGTYYVTANLLLQDADASNNYVTASTTAKPVIAAFPYNEGFENGDAGWSASGVNSSWAWGTPATNLITGAASGTKAWVTNLTGDYNSNEKSYVTGPCFNFTGIANPTISMKIFWDAEKDYDGTVLQSSIDNGVTWQNVGTFQAPNNWFNNNAISAAPGGQAAGWSGTGTNGSGGWVTASHALTGLGNLANVQLRFAFASDAGVTDDGFAFDDINISNAIAVPTITAAGPTTFCTGGSVVLTAATTTAGATFTWALNGTVIPNATGATFTATASGDYTAIATAGGTATSAATTVTVNALPTPTITGLNATYCATAPAVTLTGSIAGSTFTVNGTAATTFNPATLGAGTYTVVVSSTNASNCTGTATQTVTVTAPAATPTITASGPTIICAGSNVVLTATSATPGATYQWFQNGSAMATGTNATYTATTSGMYTVVATVNGCASPASIATDVLVNPTPATPTISQNGGVLTSSSTTGNQWFLNGVAIPGATAQTYVTTANGNYTLVVTANGCPSAASAVKNVTNTGMGEALAGMHVDVYPNPASGSFNVKLSGYQQDAAVVLYNLAGQQITATKASAEGKASNISLKGLAAGTYLLKVTSEKGVQVTRLIVQ